MDYCHACRRHLNGALACAGCGTPAEYLIPAAPADGAAAARGSGRSDSADPFADSLVVLAGPYEGRSGSRRRAAHRRRRRTTLTVGLALALGVGGSVALARMAEDGEARDRAAKVVLTDEAGPKDPAPVQSVEGPTVTVPSPVRTRKSAAATAPGGSPSEGGTGQAGPGPTGSASAPRPEEPQPSQTGPGAGGTAKPGQSGQPAPDPSSPTGSPTPTPSPTATKPPKESCFLFFCF